VDGADDGRHGQHHGGVDAVRRVASSKFKVESSK
jgi:hypothetical protein